MRIWALALPIWIAAIAAVPAEAQKYQLTPEERIELIRGITAEFAEVKIILPRARDPLPLTADAQIADNEKWDKESRRNGIAARVGELVQITKVEIGDRAIELEINSGLKGGRKWYEGIQVGMGGGNRTVPVATPNGAVAQGGTNLVIQYPDGVPPMTSAEFKTSLAAALNFDRHSPTENYIETLPEPIQAAIREERVVEGMNRDQVLLAMGKPRHKVRESAQGVESEDWIYGFPPGKITFVKFQGSAVVQVKEAYAGLGGATAPKLDPN